MSTRIAHRAPGAAPAAGSPQATATRGPGAWTAGRAHRDHCRPRRESGVALLALVAAAGAAASSLLLSALDPTGARALAERRTAEALAEARTALIGYAAGDPNRPGELPCPDFDGDGKVTLAADYAGSGCRTYRGWLPWYTLRLPDLRDGAAARLWYAVSPEFRAGGQAPLNSATRGQLALDGRDDVVAVVISPGAPNETPAGEGLSADQAVRLFLEGPNAEPEARAFASAAGNDRVMGISRADLMTPVEGRVLAALKTACEGYAALLGGAYPWPVAFTDPSRDDLADQAVAPAGLLPYHAPGRPFRTGFVVQHWDVEGARTDVLTGGTVTEADLTRGGPRRVSLSAGGGQCTWVDLETVQCRGESEAGCAAPPAACDLPPGVARRVWAFDLRLRGTVTVHPPSPADHARRDVALADGPLPDHRGVLVSVTDYDALGRRVGAGTLTVGAPSTVSGTGLARASIRITGVRLYPVLPGWYAANGWHRLVYVALARGADRVDACQPAADCLRLVDAGGPATRQDVAALAILAGPPLDRAGACGPEERCGHFEGENADADGAYAAGPVSAAFNDRVRVLRAAGEGRW